MESSLLESVKTIFRKRTFCIEWIGNMNCYSSSNIVSKTSCGTGLE